MGLSIMMERARNVGALIEVTSRIGEGTEVYVSWQQQEEDNAYE
jgi:nitrate/nitrite-specific signal transduction histidine kinase